jgi:hypothetical protein
MAPTWLRKGLAMKVLKKFGEFFNKIAKNCLIMLQLGRKKRKKERPKFPLPFFLGKKMTIFLTLDDSLQFLSYLLLPLGLTLLLKKRARLCASQVVGGGGNTKTFPQFGVQLS